jgi:hypothetical protein
MCPSASGQIQTCSQAGGITSALILASAAGSRTGAADGEKYLNPRPHRRRLIPGPAGSLRINSPGWSAAVLTR